MVTLAKISLSKISLDQISFAKMFCLKFLWPKMSFHKSERDMVTTFVKWFLDRIWSHFTYAEYNAYMNVRN